MRPNYNMIFIGTNACIRVLETIEGGRDSNQSTINVRLSRILPLLLCRSSE